MKLSRPTHHQLERFFREYFADESLKLPQIQIYVKRGAGLITKFLRVHGITLGRHIFIKPSMAKYDQKKRLQISKNLLAHEVTHVVQYQQLGFFGFLFKYLKDYFVILRGKKKWDVFSRMEAYREIPHEIEARDSAQKFVEWIYLNREN